MNDQLNYEHKESPHGIILGTDENRDEAVCIADKPGANQNVTVYGTAGTGKSRHYVLPNVLTCIDSETSFVASDCSGELFRATSKLAEEKGMKVNVLNLSKLDASDGWNCFTEIKKLWNEGRALEAETMIDILTETIISNTETGPGDPGPFFSAIESNLLSFLIRYVAISPYFAGEEYERHFGTCYDILTELIEKNGRLSVFDQIKNRLDEPARTNWVIFSGYGQKQKEAAMSALESRIRVFSNTALKEIFAHNEIDLSLPGKKPCAYYVISPIMTSQYRFLLSLFFSCILQTLTTEAEENRGTLSVPVRFFLDEFKALGRITGFENKMPVIRKYGISVSIITQDPMQIESCYQDCADTILDSCAVHLAMGINDIETATVIAERAGVATVIIDDRTGKRKMERAMLTPDEALRMNYGERDRYIVSVKNDMPFFVRPYPYTGHRLYPACERKENMQNPAGHIPERKSREKVKELKSSFIGIGEREKLEKAASSGYDIDRFRNVLRSCIGHDSQSAFAEKCGISKENLNRLLNAADPSRPAKSTLRKIADASPDKTDYDELLKLCGYEPEKEEKKKNTSFEERALANAKNIRDGMTDLIKNGMIYPSIEDFLDTYSMLYSSEREKYFCLARKEYSGTGHQNAENTIVVKSYFEDIEKEGENLIRNSCSTWFVLYYAETKSGKVVITDITTDGRSISEAGDAPDCGESFFEDRSDMEFVCSIDSKAIKDSMFRNKTIDIIAHGFGFYLEQMPDSISEFLERHKESIIQEMPGEKNYIDSYIKYPENLDKDSTCMNVEPQGMGDLEYAIGRYMLASADPISGYDGYGALIAAVMRYETDISFSWWPATTGSETENVPCIMLKDFDEDYPWEDDYEDIYYTLQKYAKELGISKIGTCITHYPKKIREYDVE